MTTALQNMLQDYIDQNGLSIAGMERQAGLKINVIRNILRGQSKRPTAETLQAISKLMGCSIQDLLQGGEVSDSVQSTSSDQLIEHPEMLKEITVVLMDASQKKNIQLTFKQFSRALEESYAYSLKKTPPLIDHTFIEWILGRV